MKIYLITILANFILGFWIWISIYLMKFVNKIVFKNFDYLVALVWWVLSWVVFYGFIPKILILFNKNFSSKLVWLSFFLWILIFFLIELFFHFHHCKDFDTSRNVHRYFSNKLMLVWTFMHNFLHWIVLYTGFLINFTFWVILTLSVFLHSIPQNIANYFMNYKDIRWVLVASFAWIIGAIFLYPFMNFIIFNKIYIISMISGMLVYLIVSDILPEFKKRINLKSQLLYLFFWIIGFLFYFLLNELAVLFLKSI